MKKYLWAALPLALCASAAVLANERPAEPATGEAAMRAGFDRETGRFRAPTAQEQQALQQAGNGRNAATVLRAAGIAQPETEAEAARTVQVHADGSVSMAVPMSLMSSLVAERGADGHLAIRHADGHLCHEHAPHAFQAHGEEAYPHE